MLSHKKFRQRSQKIKANLNHILLVYFFCTIFCFLQLWFFKFIKIHAEMKISHFDKDKTLNTMNTEKPNSSSIPTNNDTRIKYGIEDYFKRRHEEIF